MGQNALDQSFCVIFSNNFPAISLEQIDKMAWNFACWYKFMAIKSWLKNIGMGMAKKRVWSVWVENGLTEL